MHLLQIYLLMVELMLLIAVYQLPFLNLSHLLQMVSPNLVAQEVLR